ncbi:MAG TPA: peptide deformylase [Gammaproteobacteria bacterium]|jgi:peptide deformylase|nr:peptide deformylase [Gammaproteobacteria bacterium]
MALLNILVYPDSRLRTVAKPVEAVDSSVTTLVNDMVQTMYSAPGIGLAATQVNVPKRVIVMDLSAHRDELMVFINPIIESLEGEIETEEGCLSVPGIVAPVPRAERITVSALNREGESFRLDTSELLSVCIQHEVDHLNGKVFVDYLSRLKQARIRKRLLKEVRENEQPGPKDRATVY